MQSLVEKKTQPQATYDPDILEADKMTLSVSKASEKYDNWEHHRDGAEQFAHLTCLIGIRLWLCDEREIDPETFRDTSDVIEKYNSLYKWHAEESAAHILQKLKQNAFRDTIGNTLREFAVRHHACGLTTAEVISLVLDAPEGEGLTPLRYYTQYFPQMRQPIRDYLSTQLNYLKLGQPRFPEKYLDLWHTARAAHHEAIQHMPLTHVSEQVAAMQQHYQKLLDAFNALPPDPQYTRERERLTNAMTKTMSGIYQMTRDPAYPKPDTLNP